MSMSVSENPIVSKSGNPVKPESIEMNIKRFDRAWERSFVENFLLPFFFLSFQRLGHLKRISSRTKRDVVCDRRDIVYHHAFITVFTPTIKRSFTNTVLVKVLRSLLYFYCSCW